VFLRELADLDDESESVRHRLSLKSTWRIIPYNGNC
jgi:hypothetical protein